MRFFGGFRTVYEREIVKHTVYSPPQARKNIYYKLMVFALYTSGGMVKIVSVARRRREKNADLRKSLGSDQISDLSSNEQGGGFRVGLPLIHGISEN